MNLLDMRTVILSYVASNLICMVVIAIQWKQNRRRFPGLGFWLVDFVMQFFALILVALRGVVPDFLSMTVSNSMIIGGSILLLIGLEHITGKRGPHIHNYILLGVFIALHAYFVFVIPNLAARNILFSLGLLVICIQAAWLMLQKVEAKQRPMTRGVGLVFAAFSLVSISRIFIDLVVPSADDFFHSDIYDTLLLMTYQMLFVILTFSLFLMVNHRLFIDLECDIAVREKTEKVLTERMKELKCIYDLSSLNQTPGISLEEILHGCVDLLPPAMRYSELAFAKLVIGNQSYSTNNYRDSDCKLSCEIMEKGQSIGSLEVCYPEDVRQAGGCLFLEEENTLLQTVAERLGRIIERKHTEEALQQSEEKFSKMFRSSPDAVIVSRMSDGQIIEANASFYSLSGYDADEVITNSTINLGLWTDLQDREKLIAALLANQRVRDLEYDFRIKSGELLNCLYSGECIQLDDEMYLLSIVRDITKRKQMERDLRIEKEFTDKVLNTQQDTLFVFNPFTGKAIRWNKAFRDISGYSDEEISQMKAPDAFYDQTDKERAAQAVKMVIEKGFGTIELGLICKDGRKIPFEYVASVLYNDSGEPESFISVGRDITKRRQAEKILLLRLRLNEFAVMHSLEEVMQKALDEIGLITNSPIGFYHFVESDQKTLTLQAWSTRTKKEFCKAEGKGMHYNIDQAGVWVDCFHQKKVVIHNDYASLPHRKGLPPGHAQIIRELVVPTLRQGRVVSILGIGNKPLNYDNEDIELVTQIADIVWVIVERKRAEEKLRQLSRAVEQSPASIVITNTTGSIEYVNPKFTEVTGYALDEAIGENPRILKTSLTPEETHKQLWETITSGREWRGEFINRKKNGDLFDEAASISPIIDDKGAITHYVAVKEDITASRLNERRLQQANQQLQAQLEQIQILQAELREQTIRDPLTGLYNRRYLYETLGREIARAGRENYPISFVMMDIDHFKKVNDTLGHDTGDAVLKKLGTQLLSQIRVNDIVCRYGGEEFLVILPNVAVAEAFKIAERWRRSFMKTTALLGNSAMPITLSCGIAEFPVDGTTGEELISLADKALYQAKAGGRNQTVLWQKKVKSSVAASKRMRR